MNPMGTTNQQKLGLIAGNGKFPFLVLEAARSQGIEVVVAAIKEETSPDIEQHGAASVNWLSLGELSKLIEMFQREGVSRAVMAGQVKHKQIFSSIKPDWRLAKVLLSLTARNTDSLIGAIARVLESEGITLMSSTTLLEPMLADEGVLTSRGPSDAEQTNITYGRAVAQHLSRFDIGQTVVIAEAACVAVEEDANVKLGSVATDALGLSGRRMLRALIEGQRDPQQLSQLACGRLRKKISQLQLALEGHFTEHHGFQIKALLEVGGIWRKATVPIRSGNPALAPAARAGTSSTR